MINRNLEAFLLESAGHYPVCTVTGPRQSGKTTLCRMAFPNKAYVSLEPLDVQEAARSDPRGFLARYEAGAIFDEIQHVPELLSYLQVEVDERQDAGRFILTGSQHFGLTQAISQSLAGRTAVLTLLPLSRSELSRFPRAPEALFETIYAGGYPRIHDRSIAPERWLADYLTTYVQRDVRQVLNVGDLQSFTTFLRLCAGRTAQLLNLSSLADDAGINHNTARAWLSVLETSYLVFRLPVWRANLKKRLSKTPKLHFIDSGLACALLGMTSADHLRHHPLRGALFESWVVSEIFKARAHRGLLPRHHFYRDHRGLELDCIIDEGIHLKCAEVKSGATISGDYFTALTRFEAAIEGRGSWQLDKRVVYGGDERQRRHDVDVIPWRLVDALPW